MAANITLKKSNRINVCISCDDNYAKYAGVVIASVLYNAIPSDDLYFYILDGNICSQTKKQILALKSIKDCQINFVPVNKDDFVEFSKVKISSYTTIHAYYRLKLASLLPDIDKIIYLDCDIVVNTSLKKFYNTDLGEYIYAGVKDINKKILKKNPYYINSGVLLMDLDKIRKQNIEQEFLNWAKNTTKKFKTGDQTIINEVLKGKIKIVDDEWNVQSSNFTNRSSYTNSPRIVHFVSKKKPWNSNSFSYHKNLYFKYLQLTPWKLTDEELKYRCKSSSAKYIKYRPCFMLRPRFYEALFCTYIKPLFEPKKPVIKDNTFLLWEPCSKSHNEVVMGYAKYLLDLGYHVSVLMAHSSTSRGGGGILAF